jgi:pimeloyl-ACP methyl ester carboxylesterase
MTTIWADLLGCEVKYRGSQYRTRTIEAGTGDPLILMHGVGGHAEAYSRNVRRLGENFHAIAIDFIWHGFSSKPPIVASMVPHYGRQVLDLMDSMNVERAHLEGESLGGWVALWLSLNHPDRLKKVVLNTTAGIKFKADAVKVDTHGGRDALRQRSLAALESPSRETIRKRLEWLMASPDRVTDELVDIRYAIYTDPETNASLKGVVGNLQLDDNPDRIMDDMLPKITVPTLALWADKNPGVGEDGGRRISNLIPGADYYCVKDAAHWPQWEKPEEHDAVVTKFLKS